MAIPRIPKDAKAAEQEVFDDGKYKVNGFEWFSLDDKDRPCLVQQKNGLVGRLHFGQVSGEEGPPMSVTLPQMGLLARAFGISDEAMPKRPPYDRPGAISKYMTRVRDLVNGDGNVVKVTVEDGWVDSQRGVPGMEIPTGEVYLLISDLGPKEDGVPEPRVTNPQWGPWFLVTFRVVAGKGGQPSQYDGCEFTEFLSYGLRVNNTGEIEWEINKDGEYSVSALRMGRLIEYSAPDLFERSFVESDNVLPEWLDAVEENNYVMSAYRTPNETGKRKGEIHINWATLEPVQSFKMPLADPVIDADMPWEGDDEAKQEMAGQYLAELLQTWRDFFTMVTVQYKKGPAFEGENSWKPTDAGKAVARKLLSPIADKLTTRKMSEFTFEDLQVCFTAAFEALEGASKGAPEFLSEYKERYEALLPKEPEDESWNGDDDEDDDDIPF